MRNRVALGLAILAVAVAVTVFADRGASVARAADEPRTADDKAPSFKNDVMPILNNSCVNCHNNTKAKARVSVENYAGVVKIVQPGVADKSRLVRAITGNGAKPMPPKKMLTADEIATIKAWIAAGAKND